ncbi:MAG: hypothetical protein KDI07_24290, partial [Anaerolineae bacterium]|nr:hypothetical protein [Anaerolineae bacterium]
MTRWLETDSLSNQNIASALAIGSYTADADRLVFVQFFADQVAGNGDYEFYLTQQIAGAGSSYRHVPKTTATVASGVTAIAGQSIAVAVRNGDVLTLYLDGLAGDTTTPDTTVRWFESDALVTLADDAITSAKFDESTAFPLKAADSGSTYILRTGADGDTGETLSDQMDTLSTYDGSDTSGVTTLLSRLTATRAGYLDNLSAGAVALQSTLSTAASNISTILGRIIGTIASGTHEPQSGDSYARLGAPAGASIAADIAAISAGSGLTAQQTRDAMKLAPSAGAAAAGSIDDLLADILEDTGTTLPGLLAAELSSSSDSTTSGAITRTRGNTWTISATIGAITGYTSLWFTVKHSQDDADSDAILQIKLNSSGSDDDLIYVNGATASDSTLGAITVSDASTGAIIIAVDETVTDDMPAG